MNYRRIGRWAAAGAGIAAAGVGLYWLKERRTERPPYELIEADGAFELRRYPALVTAETVQFGSRERALGAGFGALADYIFAGSRPGREIAMTAPVIEEADEGRRWRTRFVMPAGETPASLPQPAGDVALGTLPPRRIAAVSFSGRADDRALDEQARVLADWVATRGLATVGRPQFAFYNSPFLPAPLRRSEVWLTLID